jgi:AraC-like DNA-binding protein
MSGQYREYRPPAGLRGVSACLWELAPAADHVQLVIPDGCVDLILLAGHGLVLAGADTGPRRVAVPHGSVSAGIRLRAAAAGAVLGRPASEIRHQEVAASLVWGTSGERLEEELAGAGPRQRLELLAQAVAARRAEPDSLVTAAGQRLAAPHARVAAVAADLGVSERQLSRRLLGAVGYGPKMLARVARLRRLIAATGEIAGPDRLARTGGVASTGRIAGADGALAVRALLAGYASQSHMTDEVRRLTGATPVRFLEDAGLTAA